MRCRICDWSPNMPGSLMRPSLANESVFAGPPEVKDWDPESRTYRCSLCDTKPVSEPPTSLTEDWPIPVESMTIGDLLDFEDEWV